MRLFDGAGRGSLDPAVAPFSVALARALGGKEVMAEEFGVCTSPDGRESYTRATTLGGRAWQQLFASDAQAAAYYRETGAGLLRVGAIGALAWIFSDYDPSLYDTPPFDAMVHERYFGLTRHDGQAKPCLEAFLALKGQTVQDPPPLTLDVPPNDDDDPARHFRELYAAFTSTNGV